MTPYQAVIFDFFGTLSQAIRRSGWHITLARAVGCDPQAFAVMLDRTFADRASGAYGDGRSAMREVAWRLGRSPTSAQVDEALRLKEIAVRSSIRLRSDVLRTLWTLRRSGLRVGLISDCTEEFPNVFASMAIAPLFDATVFSIHIGTVKPHPSLYLTACERLDVAPTECLYLGDGNHRELSGAQSVGMTAVRLNAPDLAHHLTYHAELDWPGLEVTSLSAILDLVRPLSSPRVAVGAY